MIMIKKPFLVFSVALSDNDENDFNHRLVARRLREAGVEYQEVVGCFAGVIEKSFIVLSTVKNRGLVEELCQEYEQECWLDVQKHGNVYLNKNACWDVNHVGRWEEAANLADLANGPDGKSAWTLAGGTFYIVKTAKPSGAKE